MENTIKLTGTPSIGLGEKQMSLLSKAISALHETGAKLEVTGFKHSPKRK